MRLLFLHQNFPGQYRHLAPAMAARRGVEVVALGENPAAALPGVRHLRYPAPRGAGEQTHPYLRRFEAYIRRGQEVARAALALKAKGFVPDVIAAHPGWGEALFIRDVFPDAKLLLQCEFFYRADGADIGFDPLNGEVGVDKRASTRIMNGPQLVQLEAADAGVAPTRWQWSRYPDWARARIAVVHEGIDTRIARPDGPAEFALPDGRVLRRGDPVVTYAARQLEPYRGFHSFLRALPALQRLRPGAQVVVVGGEGVSYGSPPPGGGSWKAALLAELGDSLDLSRVHFLPPQPYAQLLALFRVSAAHVYLTYPFVLSWSLLDAMACGAAVLASDTAPVTEVVAEGVNGRLVDFFDSAAIAERLAAMLAAPEALVPLRDSARRTVVERYDLAGVCLPQQVALLERVARGELTPPGSG
ncbi:MAG: glycosyltransferase [Rubritepida sp.]|nr:glycosyltransferase [Rubritepida sp.]